MIGDSFLDVSLQPDQLRFEYGPGVVGPATEFRSLDAIRGSLLDPNCAGPDPVYGIAMDVARASDMALLKERMLLYGIVAYAAGRLGEEPTRSQGHVHAIAPHSGWSPRKFSKCWKAGPSSTRSKPQRTTRATASR